ncbi:MAG TPA: heat-inducible transcription repressor HrcA [Calditrichaeota bacterium]|nr:heat-inducible transcription repressor HrcA [Calditrichota bacterium]
MQDINDREKIILRSIIRQYIDTAKPIGSAQIAAMGATELKSASIRRIMASLEEKGYLTHPHTSAGRIPTSIGYRFYVDELMQKSKVLPGKEKPIRQAIESYDGDVDILMGKLARVLASLSNQLGIIVSPRLYQSVFERMEIIPVSSDKLMVIIKVQDGYVKSILIEIRHKLDRRRLNPVVRKINQRLQGRTLMEIRDHFRHLVADLRNDDTGLVRLFMDFSERLFDFRRYENYALNGTGNIVTKPEFMDAKRFSMLVDLLEDKNIVIHLMEERDYPPGMKVTIGNENEPDPIHTCSVVTSTYFMGNVTGVLGIIGPMRMPYELVIPLVEYTAREITSKFRSI